MEVPVILSGPPSIDNGANVIEKLLLKSQMKILYSELNLITLFTYLGMWILLKIGSILRRLLEIYLKTGPEFGNCIVLKARNIN